MVYIEADEIKSLIKKGYNKEIISLEFDIPNKLMKQYELEVQAEENSKSSKTFKKEKRNLNKYSYPEIRKMREKYNGLFFKSNKEEKNNIVEKSPENYELVNSIIAEFKIILDENIVRSEKEKSECVKKVLSGLKKIEDMDLTISQAEQIYKLLGSDVLKNLNISLKGMTYSKGYKQKRTIIKKLAKNIDIAQNQTEDIEELENLSRKITIEMVENYQVEIGTLKSKISNKIFKIKQQKKIESIKNNIPENIKAIISDIAKGSVDVSVAKIAIEEEAKRRIEAKGKNKNKISEEKNQILIQIRKVLKENSEIYRVENPSATIMIFEELCDGEIESSIRAVIKNLINIKEFDKAKEVCRELLGKNDNRISPMYIKNLRNEIRNSKIGDEILTIIENDGTYEEEKMCYEQIKKLIVEEKINPKNISLGKSQDGLRNITLADILSKELAVEVSFKNQQGSIFR